MGATGFLVRTQLRRHRGRIAALALLVGLTGGVVTASLLGASRSRSSFDRFVAEEKSADLAVFVNLEDELERLAEHPAVERIGRFSMLSLVPTSLVDRDDVYVPFAASLDGAVPYEFNGYRIIDGRLPEPDVATEIALHESTAQLLGVDVGDRVEMAMFTDADLEALFEFERTPESYDTVDMDVVAVMRDPIDVIARSSDIVVTPLTPAAAASLDDEVGSLGMGAFVSVRPGTDVGQFMADLAEAMPEAQVERWIGGTEVADTGFGSTLDVIADGLLAVAAVVALGGTLAAGQAFARGATASGAEQQALTSLGLERRGARVVAAVPGLAVAGLGGILAAAVAVALSPRFPIGIARRAEPDLGIDLHPGVLFGGLAVTACTMTVALAASTLANRDVTRSSRSMSSHVNFGPLAGVVGSGNASLARSTQLAVAFGGLAVAAALVFATSLDRLLETPQRYGWTFDSAVVSETHDPTILDEGVDVAADPAVAAATEAVFQIQLTIDGRPSMGYAIGDAAGPIAPVAAKGRAPMRADEVALGRETMRDLGVGIGDQVTIAGAAGPSTFQVVGQAVLPVSSDGGRVGNGAAFVLAALPRLGIADSRSCGQETCYRQVLVRWEDGADQEAAARRLLAVNSAEFVRPVPPPEVERLSEVDAMPWIVSGILAALAAAAAGHAVVVTVHRRGRDLAVLRALGATPGQTRRAVSLHLVVLITGWAIVGTVLGVVVGRFLWVAVASSVGVAPVPTVPVSALVVLPLLAVGLTQLAAVVPARRASRHRPTQVLRSE